LGWPQKPCRGPLYRPRRVRTPMRIGFAFGLANGLASTGKGENSCEATKVTGKLINDSRADLRALWRTAGVTPSLRQILTRTSSAALAYATEGTVPLTKPDIVRRSGEVIAARKPGGVECLKWRINGAARNSPLFVGEVAPRYLRLEGDIQYSWFFASEKLTIAHKKTNSTHLSSRSRLKPHDVPPTAM
jgi:hypothetical protein